MTTLRWLDQNFERYLVGLLLAAIVLLISTNVIMRYVLNASLSWGEELTLWLFVWFVWMAISYALRFCWAPGCPVLTRTGSWAEDGLAAMQHGKRTIWTRRNSTFARFQVSLVRMRSERRLLREGNRNRLLCFADNGRAPLARARRPSLD